MSTTTPRFAFAGLFAAALSGSAVWAIGPRVQEPAAKQADEEKAIAA